MKQRNGFTVLELVIVVAVAGIIASMVIPALVRARVAANESATIGDIRTVLSAQAAYRTANAGYFDSNLACLVGPSAGCIPGYPTSAPTFLDSTLASQVAKAGYNRYFQGGPAPPIIPPNASLTSTLTYRYDATPTIGGVTGVRGFAADASERICFTLDGASVPPGAPFPEQLPANCRQLR